MTLQPHSWRSLRKLSACYLIMHADTHSGFLLTVLNAKTKPVCGSVCTHSTGPRALHQFGRREDPDG